MYGYRKKESDAHEAVDMKGERDSTATALLLYFGEKKLLCTLYGKSYLTKYNCEK